VDLELPVTLRHGQDMNIHFDSSDFEKKFGNIVKKAIPALVEKGLGRAMLDLMNDCVMEVPTVPLKEGWLRGSASIFVQNKFVADSTGLPNAKAGKAIKAYVENVMAGRFIGLIGFNTPYAAKMHEGIDFHFSEPSSGPKYLESKMITKKNVYMRVIAETIKGGSGA
jgi:hypothetical protein